MRDPLPLTHIFARLRRGWEVVLTRGPSQIQFWFIALAVGVASGYAAVAFMTAIRWLQAFLYGTDDIRMIHSFAATLPWFWVLTLPALGGLVVGFILTRFTPDGRVRGVAEVIQGAAMNEGRVERRAGVASAVSSLITLSSGGSSGREGPVVHITGLIAGWVSNRINADGITGRDLLGCAVAAGVAASFNAPIAGALFALEVVLRHFAVHAFAPITIAAVSGSVISRTHFGDVTEFTLPGVNTLAFYVELPAFLLLGLLCGLVAVVLMRSVFFVEDVATRLQARSGLPPMLRPAVSGLLLGAMAIWFPHIIGVGYETTSAALSGELLLHEAMVFAVLKVAAVSITMGGRMGGGIFSPALMVGALTGLAFGIVATGLLPEVSGAETLYALAGMGAVAAAVLGAPISTTLIVFELTGDWQTGLAVLVAVSMSTALSSRLVDRSFFLTQLERRGIHLAAGPQAYLLAMFRVSSVMKSPDHPRAPAEERVRAAINEALFVAPSDTLETAMPLFEKSGREFLAVVRLSEKSETPEIVGVLLHIDALRVYNRALAATAAEEHS
ncbi:chloride channel protein [Jannaschia seohaensis]|uniref:CIC family chloride channel protein n=1 Tax=Jannaschia seohaensis TaxID=475081 RepID=A0A2Y9C8X9_9RHOB|nr:chloride channel protein [Jannaschia seohaensis]PWJ13327.1 CIC family chloride channel protein [Jannaschia seohaensis]SSA50653.1 chloride channel protein, CIC family [Jannaschia seohaensis]